MMTIQHQQFAKQLRYDQTLAESKLWHHLRNRHCLNLKFRRQIVMDHSIADFICHKHPLLIEVDGGQHASQQIYDQTRTAWFQTQGFSVLRFWNNDVMKNIEGVLHQIQRYIETTPHPTLSRAAST